jgi:hypothetical protein
MAGVEDMMAGTRLFRDGKPLPDNATPAFKYGYNMAKAIAVAATKPPPGTPGPHEHSLIGKAE